MKTKIRQLLKDKTGAFSIEMLLVIGIIVVLVVLAMTAFARESSEVSNQYDNNVSDAMSQQGALNNKLATQNTTIYGNVSFK